MNENAKSSLAELIGTFTLVFIGAGAGISTDLVGVALAHGLALLVIVYAWGSISGAHVNPAVTLGVLLTGRIDLPKALMYWAAQFVGAALAAYLLLYLVGEGPAAKMETIGQLTGTDSIKVIIIEAILTFFLLIAVFASGIGGRSGNAAGAAIGLVLTMDILAGGPWTGASMNPARSFGPALAMGDLSYLWMYLVGPFIGGAAGALLYDQVFLPAKERAPVEAARDSGAKH